MTALIKWLLILINIMAVLALGLVKAGSLVSPEKMLLPAYASLFLLPLTLLNIGFVVFWIAGRKWVFLLSMLALIVFYKLY